MGRGKGKGKNQSVIAKREKPFSVEEEKVPSYRKRGRPVKSLPYENEEVEVTEKIEKDEENVNSNELKTEVMTVIKRKRKRSIHVKEKIDPAKDENCIRAKSSSDDFVKSVGFRQNRSRCKNKPRRAAEAGVDCN